MDLPQLVVTQISEQQKRNSKTIVVSSSALEKFQPRSPKEAPWTAGSELAGAKGSCSPALSSCRAAHTSWPKKGHIFTELSFKDLYLCVPDLRMLVYLCAWTNENVCGAPDKSTQALILLHQQELRQFVVLRSIFLRGFPFALNL